QRGTEVVAGTAAALAAASVVFRDTDPAYADELVTRAAALYRFGEAFPGNDAYQRAARQFYRSYSGWRDELAWGAVWLHLATGDAGYLDRARDALAGLDDFAT